MDLNADLTVVDYAKLLRGDSEARRLLLQAARYDGFFYLDLRQHCCERGGEDDLLTLVDRLYRLAQQLFDHSEEEKMHYDLDVIGPHKISGYKPIGRNTGVSAQKQDGVEGYMVSTNEIECADRQVPPPQHAVVVQNQPTLTAIVEQSHKIGHVIMQSLSHSLETESSSIRFENSHRRGRPSTSALGLLKYPPRCQLGKNELGQSAHTDVGSITLLFARVMGLQVLDTKLEEIQSDVAQNASSSEARSSTLPDSGWRWIVAHPGYAVVNIGDSLRFLAGSRLKSCLHRVVPYPYTTDEARNEPRYSLAYFMRPEYDAVFFDDDGERWTGLGWHMRKFKTFRAPASEQKEDSVLTGRKGYLGLWDASAATGTGKPTVLSTR